ncbi:MAG: Pr6Pr family membrane protein [Chitinophagales bacterium]|nr:Pr6Pr family membrane protein [Chitinophagales bacterium]
MELYINKKNFAELSTFIVTKKVYEIIAALVSSFGLIVQWIIIQERAVSQGLSFWTSAKISILFMTIWTNVLICALFWLFVFNVKNSLTTIQAKSAALTYILIVFTIYHFFLAGYWNPTGKVALTNLIFHYIVPAIYTLYWLLFTNKKPLPYQRTFVWLWFPAVYAAVIFTHGYFTKIYPYPIYNLEMMPTNIVIRNVVLTLVAYLVFGLSIILLNNFIIVRNRRLAE